MGIFGQMDEGESGDGDDLTGIKSNGDRRRKRWFQGFVGGGRSCTSTPCADEGVKTDDARPAKRRRRENRAHHDDVPENNAKSNCELNNRKSEGDTSLTSLPEDLLSHCLSFLGGVEDRYALQCTSRQFRRISNSDEMLIGIQVGGNKETGLNGIITEKDTPETAATNLAPFVHAGNLEAVYMLGIIKSYCSHDVEEGISLLRSASLQGYVRASYALGLVLRDSHPKEAADYMLNAANAGYIPALQEVLPPRQMKAQYGEPRADELRRHLDPLCLNRLLGRHYVKSADLRELNTSHCWNPLCGRWAFKAVTSAPIATRSFRQRRHAAHRRAAALSFQQNQNVVLSDPSSLDNNIEPSQFFDPSSVSPVNNATSGAGDEPARTPHSLDVRVSRMKMCSRCCRAKYCSKLCQVYDWRSGRHKMECQFL
ncbi:hypothetical protein ACA910_010326 [Epithemia clementina (nom. ined.)]